MTSSEQRVATWLVPSIYKCIYTYPFIYINHIYSYSYSYIFTCAITSSEQRVDTWLAPSIHTYISIYLYRSTSISNYIITCAITSSEQRVDTWLVPSSARCMLRALFRCSHALKNKEISHEKERWWTDKPDTGCFHNASPIIHTHMYKYKYI